MRLPGIEANLLVPDAELTQYGQVRPHRFRNTPRRRLPWQPAPDAEMIEAFHVYDVPLQGHLRQAGTDFLFWCVDDPTAHAGISAWAYALVTEEELTALRAAPDFDAAFEQVTAGKPLTVAFYSEEDGIVGSVVVMNPAAYRSIFDAILDELQQMVREFGGKRSPAMAT